MLFVPFEFTLKRNVTLNFVRESYSIERVFVLEIMIPDRNSKEIATPLQKERPKKSVEDIERKDFYYLHSL